MTNKNNRARSTCKIFGLVLVMVLIVGVLASCGSKEADETKTSASRSKLPPGLTEDELDKPVGGEKENVMGEEEDTDEQNEETSTTEATQTPGATADLVGGRFTVVSATRPDTNGDVITSEQREIQGDYLELELAVENIGDDLIDLSHYSFRLESPGIAADTYYDYYGGIGTYGEYVSENVISAALLDYSNLQPVGYKLKKGELVDKVFLFFDLNPESTARNEGVTKDNTNLIIRKVSGSDYGEEVTVNLAGYPD